jgi:xylulose-5-phosphate/fructose-6-phosphate phosphoketolase
MDRSLEPEELRTLNAYWRACNYLSVGMIYLRANALLREPLKPEHIKNRLLGHWGSDPGQSFTWIHLNRLIRKYDLNVIYVAGPGHGAPATLANAYLEGHYSEIYPDCSTDEAGLLRLFRRSVCANRAASSKTSCADRPARSTLLCSQAATAMVGS